MALTAEFPSFPVVAGVFSSELFLSSYINASLESNM